ncbi:MAG: PepSY-associated TM helix domain-containing protein [Myxococcota bacterium]
MKAKTVKNAVEAHGWVGVIVSVVLFIVFWAGAVTLFYPEVTAWSNLPLRPTKTAETQAPPLKRIIEERIAAVDHDPTQSIFIRLPHEHSEFIELHIPRTGGAEHADFLVDPASGQTLAEGHPFELSSFLYALHYNLKLPQGSYIVGLVTLFFLVLLMTGVVIQLKHLITHFFLYRHDKGRQMRSHDLHTVVGVVTLPFTIMYSLTGLMFNLGILFYLPIMVLAYGWNQNAMFADAGFPQVEVEPAGVALEIPALEPLLERVEAEHNTEVASLGLINPGDENAVIRFNGGSGFDPPLNLYYEVKSDSFPAEFNPPGPNVFASTVRPMFVLHMGHFGGPGVRFIYFVLALGVCGMIIAGNVLWLIKREKKRERYPRSWKVIQGLTVGACAGVVVATSAAFLLERVIPVDLEARSTLVQGAFFVVLLGVSVVGFFPKSIRAFLSRCAFLCAGLLGTLVAADVVFWGSAIADAWRDGHQAVAGVTIGFGLCAIAFAWLGRAIAVAGSAHSTTKSTSAPQPALSGAEG